MIWEIITVSDTPDSCDVHESLSGLFAKLAEMARQAEDDDASPGETSVIAWDSWEHRRAYHEAEAADARDALEPPVLMTVDQLLVPPRMYPAA